MCETRLSLVPDRQNQDRVMFRFVAVERYIACLSTGNDQLTNAVFDRATDQVMALQDGHRLSDQFNGLTGGQRISVNQKVSESIKIIECAGRIDQPRHERALGFANSLPETLAFRKA
jgi:hypothetical protein